MERLTFAILAIYSEDRVRALFSRMRSDLHDQHFRHLCEMADLRRELNELRTAYSELRAAALARQNVEQELASFYCERANRTSEGGPARSGATVAMTDTPILAVLAAVALQAPALQVPRA